MGLCLYIWISSCSFTEGFGLSLVSYLSILPIIILKGRMLIFLRSVSCLFQIEQVYSNIPTSACLAMNLQLGVEKRNMIILSSLISQCCPWRLLQLQETKSDLFMFCILDQVVVLRQIFHKWSYTGLDGVRMKSRFWPFR